MNIRLASALSLAALLSFGARPLAAQTATWIGSGSYGTTAAWENPAHWDTGAVPGAGDLAIINTGTAGYDAPPIPGGAMPEITSDVSLAQLRFDLSGVPGSQFYGLYLGSHDHSVVAPGHLELTGAGLSLNFPSATGYNYVYLHLERGSILDFRNTASIQVSSASGGAPALFFWLNGTPDAPATLRLYDDSSLGDNLRSGSWIPLGTARFEFHDRTSAGSAYSYYPLRWDSVMEFSDQATAGSARIQFLYTSPTDSSVVRFRGHSSAAQAVITSQNLLFAGAVEFTDQASGGSASISARRLDISGAATGTGTTGRQRATTSALAPTSVVADDARTITLSSVTATDVLLGSNTLEVGSGYIYNLRDSGGAYLSASGANLVGGRIVKVGTGTLVFGPPAYDPANNWQPSYNVFSGETIVRQGSVALYGNRLANVTVESAGSFGGYGLVAGNLANQGTFTPQFYGTLHVAGNFTQSSNGTLTSYLYDVPTTPLSASLQVDGTATLAGKYSTFLSARYFPNYRPGVLTLPLLTAGAISGRFDTVQINGTPRLRTELTYTSTTATLRAELLPFASLAVTPSQRALAAYLDASLGSTYYPSTYPNNYIAIADMLDSTGSVSAFLATLDPFAPDRYGALPASAFHTAALRRTALDRTLASARTRSEERWAVSFAGSTRRQKLDPVDGLPASRAKASGGVATVAWRGGAWQLGAWFAAEKSRLELDELGSRAEVKSTEPGVFAAYARGGFFADAALSLSRDRQQLRRVVPYFYYTIPRLAHDAASPDATRRDLSATAGYTWRRGSWTLTPFLGLTDSRWECDDFVEASDNPNNYERLDLRSWSLHSQRLRAGATWSGEFVRGRLRPSVTAAWWRELDTDRTIPTRFFGAATGYAAPGRAAERNLAQLSATLEWRAGRHTSLFLSGSGTRSEISPVNHEFTIGVQWGL